MDLSARTPSAGPRTAAVATAARFTAVILDSKYRSDDKRFAVLRAQVVERLNEEAQAEDALRGAETTIIGAICDLRIGQLVEIEGVGESHPKWRRQIRVTACMRSTGHSEAGVRAYLASLPRIGAARAQALVGKFGADEALRLLDVDIEAVAAVIKVKPAQLVETQRVHAESRHERDARLILAKCGILGAGTQNAIIRRFGAALVPMVVDENPYRLMEASGVGWATADAAAKKLDVKDDDPRRVTAACGVLVAAMLDEGHCCADPEQLAGLRGGPEAQRVTALGLSPEKVLAGLGKAALSETDPEDGRVYFASALRAERRVAEVVGGIVKGGCDRITPKPALLRDLHPVQAQAAEVACRSPVSVITGPPGVGKTAVIKRIIEALDRCGPVALCAPTGAAAKRMAEETGRPAQTIHRLLEWSQGQFQRRKGHCIEAGLVVVDETSMIPIDLAANLFSALAPHTKLVLVGDVDQLPSVGPGSVLKDVIDSGAVPVTRLTHVFRQAEGSAIKLAAQAINAGQLPPLDGQGDFLFVPMESHGDIREAVIEAVSRGIQRQRGIAPTSIQVIAPMKRGDIGTVGLNDAVQQALNPPMGDRWVRVGLDGKVHTGDRVVQKRNSYKLGVMNGEVGYVVDCDPQGLPIRFAEKDVDDDDAATGATLSGAPIGLSFGPRKRAAIVTAVEAEADSGSVEDQRVVLAVDFAGQIVGYRPREAHDLQLAYAITCHSSQGGQYGAVVFIAHRSHYRMLHRCLLYTGVSRARKLCLVIGQEEAVARAVENNVSVERRTGLARRVRAACEVR